MEDRLKQLEAQLHKLQSDMDLLKGKLDGVQEMTHQQFVAVTQDLDNIRKRQYAKENSCSNG